MTPRGLRAFVSLAVALSTAACSSADDSQETATTGVPCAGPCPASRVKYLVVIVQENHTFDDHFGRYCKAPPGSNPMCTDGPACCEAGPDTDPGSGVAPTALDDAELGQYDPDHFQACELEEIDGGAMDKFVTASCGNPANFAYADPAIVAPYWDLAAKYSLADRYFQPIAGASSSNDMYLARAGYVFTDNAYEPEGAVGAACTGVALTTYSDVTIGDLLNQAEVPWAFFAEGYRALADLNGTCPSSPPPECPAGATAYPCIFDPGDVPFEYYGALRDSGAMRDYGELADALSSGTLPAVSFVKAIGYRTEHPGASTRFSDGVAFVTSTVDAIAASKYADDVLVLVTYDEGGGYFDHVSPPRMGPVDGKPYGTRIPLLAIGPFAKKGHVSHVVMEHSSLVKFVEWNWLGKATGQLKERDAAVSNIGSLLDPASTGETVPE